LEAFFNESQQTTNELINATWQRMATECGIGPQFISTKNKRLQQLTTDGWLKSVWEFVSEYDIIIQQTNRTNNRHKRDSTDSYIMLDVCQAN
jgi:hypothetical protein